MFAKKKTNKTKAKKWFADTIEHFQNKILKSAQVAENMMVFIFS